MSDDLLTRIRREIDDRLSELRLQVAEIEVLEAALKALDGAAERGAGPHTARARRPRAPRPARRRGATKRAPRGANRAAILKLIEQRPDASSAEISARTGIARPTLYTTLRLLTKEGLVEKRDVGGVSGYHLAKAGPE